MPDRTIQDPFGNLEIAGYDLLRRVAERAGDAETVAVAERILGDERRAAERIAQTWHAATDTTLGKLVGVS
jgi:ferritin-like metal-binding protein YciE